MNQIKLISKWLTWSRALAVCAGLVVLGLVLLLAGEDPGREIVRFESWISSLGPMAFLVFVLLYPLLSSLLVPDTVLGVVAGASFGLGRGISLAIAGSMLAVVLQYFLSQHLLKPTIDRLVARRPQLAAIQRAVLRHELKLQLLIRLTPLNRALVSYTLGAAGVRIGPYLVACLALIPHIVLEVYLGYAGTLLVRSGGQAKHSSEMQDGLLVLGLVVAIVVMVVVSLIARRALAAAAEEAADSASAGPGSRG